MQRKSGSCQNTIVNKKNSIMIMHKHFASFWLVLSVLAIYVVDANAQRMSHGASRGAAFGRGGAGTRSVNGGNFKSPDRSIRTNPSSENLSGVTNRVPNQNLSGTTDRTNINRTTNNNTRNVNKNNARNSNNTNVSGNTNISGNTVNINVDRSRDINVVNNRNTVVRPNPIAYYPRPPYVYGGRRFYAFHPYYYHPYHPFYWGPVWHPWGFFVAALATTAIIVSVENAQYQYDQGVWYSSTSGGYTVVQAPVGGTVTTIPANNQPVVINNVTNYYYGGAYYEKTADGQYKVVPPPAGAIVDNLPEGGEEVKIGDQTYVKIGETYYQPVKVDGKDKYEVVQVESGDADKAG
jgi:hypothetical protein